MKMIKTTFRKQLQPLDHGGGDASTKKKQSFSDRTVLSEDDDDCDCPGDDVATPHPQAQAQRKIQTAVASTASGVSFDTVLVREYNRVLGDWWDVPNGLAIGWKYDEHEPEQLPKVAVQEATCDHTKRRGRSFRNILQRLRLKTPKDPPVPAAPARPLRRRILTTRRDSSSLSSSLTSSFSRRRYDKTPTTSSQRVDILQDFGFTSEELEEAELQRERTKFERYLMDNMPTCNTSAATDDNE